MTVKYKQIMVLNDGETFTNLDGCFIMAVPVDAETEDIEAILEDSDDTESFVVSIFREDV